MSSVTPPGQAGPPGGRGAPQHSCKYHRYPNAETIRIVARMRKNAQVHSCTQTESSIPECASQIPKSMAGPIAAVETPPETSQCSIWKQTSFSLGYFSAYLLISLCVTKTTSNYFCVGSKPVVCGSIGDSRSNTMPVAPGSTTWTKLFVSDNPATHDFRYLDPQTPSTARSKLNEGFVRMHTLALEHKRGHRIPSKHPLMAWLVKHVADVYTKDLQGIDGRTAYDRPFGKQIHKERLKFSKIIFFEILCK